MKNWKPGEFVGLAIIVSALIFYACKQPDVVVKPAEITAAAKRLVDNDHDGKVDKVFQSFPDQPAKRDTLMDPTPEDQEYFDTHTKK